MAEDYDRLLALWQSRINLQNSFSKSMVEQMPGSLTGTNVAPLEEGHFNGTVWVPQEFFTEGRTDQEALRAYLNSDHLEKSQDIWKDIAAPTAAKLSCNLRVLGTPCTLEYDHKGPCVIALATQQLFRPDLLERMLQISPGAALAELGDEVDNERVKLFGSSVHGNGMHEGNRVVFDVRFSIEVL